MGGGGDAHCPHLRARQLHGGAAIVMLLMLLLLMLMVTIMVT